MEFFNDFDEDSVAKKSFCVTIIICFHEYNLQYWKQMKSWLYLSWYQLWKSSVPTEAENMATDAPYFAIYFCYIQEYIFVKLKNDPSTQNPFMDFIISLNEFFELMEKMIMFLLFL